MGRIDGKRRKTKEQRILVPEHVRPRSIAHRQTDIHAEEYAQEQLAAFQPAGNPLRDRTGGSRR
jgi:hypothetical protein